MTHSDENNEDSSPSSETEEEPKKTLADYTEEELEELNDFERKELEREAQIKARIERDKRLDVLRNGLAEAQARIKRILELQKNMGRIPDVDGKAAISYCISAIARHTDEKAFRNALMACLNYLKMQKEREEYEIAENAKKKAKAAAEKEAAAGKKKGFFRRK